MNHEILELKYIYILGYSEPWIKLKQIYVINLAIFVLWHVFYHLHDTSELRVSKVPHDFKNQRLKSSDLGPSHLHGFDANVPIMPVHRADGVDHQGDIVTHVK